MTHKFNINDKVIYDGLVATIESRDFYVSGTPCYGLVSDENPEFTCTAGEDEVEPHDGSDIDQTERLRQAQRDSDHIAFEVDSITDKYYGC